jgi:hypothetical protein
VRSAQDPDRNADLDPDHILKLRLGHGANCSSIGSVVDTLFATAVVGAALFASVVGALKSESVRERRSRESPDTTDEASGEASE